MEEQLRLIAQRILALREIAGETEEAVAAMLQLPVEMYRRYEGGEADIPVSVLHRLARFFGVELSALLTGEEPRLHGYCLVRRGKGVSVERRREYAYQHLAFNFAHKKAEPFLVTVAPKLDAEISLNSHPGQEFNYVLAGELKIVVGGREMVLHAGDALFFDAAQPHGMLALGDEPAEFLAVVM